MPRSSNGPLPHTQKRSKSWYAAVPNLPVPSSANHPQWNTFAADGGTDIHAALSASGEPPVPEIAVSYGTALGHLPVGTVNDLWATQKHKHAYQARYLQYWASTGAATATGEPVDAVIAPASPSASFKPTQGKYFGYTGVFNVLDYSVAVVRSGTRAERARDVGVGGYEPLNDFDKAVAGDCEFAFESVGYMAYMLTEILGVDDPDVFHGMPIGLQVVCQRLEEEKVLAVAEEVQIVLDAAKKG